jgi:hypothetical protein
MNRKSAIRSLIAYLDHIGEMYPCKHGHMNCAIRREGVCLDELLSLFPQYAEMSRDELLGEKL